MLYKPMPYKRLFTVIKSIIAIKLVQNHQITKLPKGLCRSKCRNWWNWPIHLTCPNHSKSANMQKVLTSLNTQTGEND